MKSICVFGLSVVLSAASAIHASTLNPLTDGFTLNVGNSAVTNANTTYNAATGSLTFSNLTETYTFAETSATPLINALSLTRTCITVNLAGCSSETVSISNANVLNGLVQISTAVGVTLQASATAGVSNLLFAQTNAAAGAQTAIVGYPNGAATGITPEPSSLALLGTGMLTVYGLARRRMREMAA